MFSRLISALSRFLWLGFWTPMAVRSSGVILTMMKVGLGGTYLVMVARS